MRDGLRGWAVFGALVLFLLGPSAAGAAPLRPTLFADTSTPTNTIVSYYNAIDRGEYARAYTYLLSDERPLYRHFTEDFVSTSFVKLGPMRLLGYVDVSSMRAAICVGVRLTSIDRQGQRTGYHGWYIVESTTGEEPTFGGWRIDLPASHIVPNRRGLHPMHDLRCKIV